MERVRTIQHPLVNAALSVLRNRDTAHQDFRAASRSVASALIVEGTRNLPVKTIEIETPLAPFKGVTLETPVIFVPILRAGLSLLEEALALVPSARVGMIGLERDEHTAVARQYYGKFPSISADAHVFILDPMLATGGSALDTVKALRKLGVGKLTLLCCVAAPEGIQTLLNADAGIEIVTASIDSHLNDKKYIVPGLGDFGDRYFGTC